MKAWYLIQTKPRQERQAEENLARQGYTTYLPISLVRRRRRNISSLEPGPMFPRYLFINLSEGTDDWAPIRSTLGVARLVRFGQVPARVPDSLITALKAREDNNGVQILPDKDFRVGDKVRIAGGPFEGYEAIIQSRSSRERLVLMMKVIESYFKLEIRTSDLEPLSD